MRLFECSREKSIIQGQHGDIRGGLNTKEKIASGPYRAGRARPSQTEEEGLWLGVITCGRVCWNTGNKEKNGPQRGSAGFVNQANEVRLYSIGSGEQFIPHHFVSTITGLCLILRT